MPFPFIPTALGISFFLIWAFIGAMIFRDSQLAVRRDQEVEGGVFSRSSRPLGSGPHVTHWGSKTRRRAARAAS